DGHAGGERGRAERLDRRSLSVAGSNGETSAGNRFGEIAVREGFATRAQVRECLEIQTKLRSYGVEPKKLGEILVEKGYLKPADTLAILEVQRQGASRIETRSGVGSRARVSAATRSEEHTSELQS